MKKLLVLLIVFLFLFSCGKKSPPEYEGKILQKDILLIV